MNKNKLLYLIKEAGYPTLPEFCEHIGITYQSFYNKLSGASEFPLRDLQNIKETLNLSAEEFCTIFFVD